MKAQVVALAQMVVVVFAVSKGLGKMSEDLSSDAISTIGKVRLYSKLTRLAHGRLTDD